MAEPAAEPAVEPEPAAEEQPAAEEENGEEAVADGPEAPEQEPEAPEQEPEAPEQEPEPEPEGEQPAQEPVLEPEPEPEIDVVAVVARSDVALPVKAGPELSQPASFLSVRSLHTATTKGGAGDERPHDERDERPARGTGHSRFPFDTSGRSRASRTDLWRRPPPRSPRPPRVHDLCFAAHRGDLAEIEAVLFEPEQRPEGVKVNATDARGLSAMHWAVTGNQHAAVSLLLERGADVNLPVGGGATGGTGKTALHYATDCLMIELLLQAKADHSVIDASKRTAAEHHAHCKRVDLGIFVSPPVCL